MAVALQAASSFLEAMDSISKSSPTNISMVFDAHTQEVPKKIQAENKMIMAVLNLPIKIPPLLV
jgi:predicted RNA-binding protein with PIN domain